MIPEPPDNFRPMPCKKRRNSMTAMLWLGAALCVFFFIALFPMMTAGAKEDAYIKIPVNATSQDVADSITKYLGKGYSKKVMKLLSIRRVDFKKRHGEYLISKGTSPFTAMRKLGSGAQSPVKITINGFRLIDNMANKIALKMDFNREEMLRAITDTAMLAHYGLTKDQTLALFIDDSYYVYWTSSPEETVKKIGDNYNRIWNPTRRRKARELGLSPAEVVTIASICDEETLQDEEKGRIARVYINRLRKGMKLQSDPTVRFALKDFSIRRVKGSHLNADSPYNTYRYAGLPPGPIRTTSEKTIDLVLNSTVTDELYMCAKEDFSGYHNFASTYEEHVQNALRYQHALDTKGIN